RVGVPHGDRAAAPRGPVPTEQPPVRVAAAAGVHEVTPRGHTPEGRPRHVRSRRDGKHFSTRTRRGRVAATTVGGGLTTPGGWLHHGVMCRHRRRGLHRGTPGRRAG